VTRIVATLEQTFQVGASPQKAYTFFSMLEKLRAATPGVERCEVFPEGRVHWVLEARVDKGIRFQPDFVVAYEGNGVDHVRCRFIEGNMADDWEAWIKPSPGGSEILYRETVAPDLPITAALALLIKPLIAKELRKDVTRFLDRVREELCQ
jgi:carbon monoxide dehydrogenase subunit G